MVIIHQKQQSIFGNEMNLGQLIFSNISPNLFKTESACIKRLKLDNVQSGVDGEAQERPRCLRTRILRVGRQTFRLLVTTGYHSGPLTSLLSLIYNRGIATPTEQDKCPRIMPPCCFFHLACLAWHPTGMFKCYMQTAVFQRTPAP